MALRDEFVTTWQKFIEWVVETTARRMNSPTITWPGLANQTRRVGARLTDEEALAAVRVATGPFSILDEDVLRTMMSEMTHAKDTTGDDFESASTVIGSLKDVLQDLPGWVKILLTLLKQLVDLIKGRLERTGGVPDFPEEPPREGPFRPAE